MLVLNEADVRTLLTMPDCIEAMHGVFTGMAQGAYFNPLRQRARPEGNANWITMMPVMRTAAPRLWALKEMAVTPANAAQGLDPIQGAVMLHDGDDGCLLAVVHAAALTAIRTAAVSAVATRALARPDARTVAIIGSGVQGRAHIEAMRCVLPLAQVRVWSRDPARALRLVADAASGAGYSDAAPGKCDAVASIEAAIRGADVVCTVTAALEPVTQAQWFAPGCHLNAVGSSTPAAQEIDATTLARASLFVDRREAALAESGDILAALRVQAITPTHIRAELGEVLIGRQPGRSTAQEFTLYKALGFAALDLAAAELAVRRARERGVGVEVPW